MAFNGLTKLKIKGLNMFNINMPQLKIGNLVPRVPIIQGGMGVGISLSGLASAVARAGGIGIIAANAIGMLEPDYNTNGLEANKRALRKEIQKARSKTDGVIGVNIMVALNDFHELLQIAIEESADLVFLGAGLPLKGLPIEAINRSGLKVVPIVSSGRAARLIFSYWQKQYGRVPDAVVVEGPKAGGHLGFKREQIDDPNFALELLVPDVVKEIARFEELTGQHIPVIAAGGIYDGEDIYKFFKLGARGVQMATRFVATHECDADETFKETFINSKQEDIMIIKSPVGMPGRAIRNNFLEEVDAGIRQKYRCAWKCLDQCHAKQAHYCISQALDSARHGNMLKGYAFAGANAYRIDRLMPVESLMLQLTTEYLEKVGDETVDLWAEFEDSFKKLVDLKDEYALSLKKGTAAFQKEINHAKQKLDLKIDHLKDEYADHFDKVHGLKEQLSRYFDTSRLTLPKASLT